MRRLVAALIALLLAFTARGMWRRGRASRHCRHRSGGSGAGPAPRCRRRRGGITHRRSARRSPRSSSSHSRTGRAFPQSVTDRLADGKAMVLLFYNSDQDVTNDLRKQVDIVAEDNTGMIDLLTYDLGKSAEVDDSGKVVVDEEELTDDPKGQEAVSFARLLGIDSRTVPSSSSTSRDTRSSSRAGSSTPSCSSAKWSARPSRRPSGAARRGLTLRRASQRVLGTTTRRLRRGCVPGRSPSLSARPKSSARARGCAARSRRTRSPR